MNEPFGVISDTHDREEFVNEAVEYLNEEGVEHVFHLGDVCSSRTLDYFEDFEMFHLILGNGDFSNHRTLIKHVDTMGGVCHGESYEFSYERSDGTVFQVLMRHGYPPDGVASGDSRSVSYSLAALQYDYVFHGHYHYHEVTEVGDGVVIDPGADGVIVFTPTCSEWKQQQFDVSVP